MRRMRPATRLAAVLAFAALFAPAPVWAEDGKQPDAEQPEKPICRVVPLAQLGS